MATQAQLDANRANAQKSTGPRTPEGRAAVRQNALKHGLTSMSPVAPGENPAEFLQFLDRWSQAYLPIGPAEEEVLRTAVVASWRLRRIPAIEAGYYEMEQSGDHDQSPPARLAFAHYACAKQLEALSCHEARLQRTFDKSLRELERLQSLPSRNLKTGLENQTQFSTEGGPSPGAADEPVPAASTQTPGPVPDAAGSEESSAENQTQMPAGTEPPESENQTQSPAQTDETETESASAQPALPQPVRNPIPRRAPLAANEIERRFAAKIVARMFAGLPKTA